MENKRFSIAERIKSFKYAFSGLKLFIRYDHNGRIHLIASILAIVLSIFLKISSMEWVAICIAIATVLVAEIFNSAIEELANVVTPDINPKIKIVKDLAAGAVLITAILAIVIGLIVLLPKILLLLHF